MNREEAANTIEAFIAGTSGPWDWDDFLHTKTKDEMLSGIQKLCMSIPDRYPPDRPNHYCNDKGLEALKEVIKTLRTQTQ